MRTATVTRTTNETDITLTLAVDGSGRYDVATGIGFFDHMLEQLAKHSGMDLTVRATGDLHIDGHHTVEDVGIALGQALKEALGERRGIARYAHAFLPMDEALTRVALDMSGRPFLVFEVPLPPGTVGGFDLQLVREFFQAVATNAGLTLHMDTLRGANSHHIAESCFKGFARALGAACTVDPARAGVVPSTKGTLSGIDMAVTTLHRRSDGDPDAVRVVVDGFRLSAFLFAPAALLAARLWLAFLGWAVGVVVAIGCVVAGWLSPGAALLAVALLHLGFALDMADAERRRLRRRGWTTVAIAGPLGVSTMPDVAEPASPLPAAAPAPSRAVLGLFPDGP